MRRFTPIIVLLGLVAAGCGGSSAGGRASTPHDSLTAVQAAARATSAARSMRLAGHLTMNLGGNAGTSDFTALFRGRPLAMRMTMSNLVVNGQSFGSEINALLTPTAMYMRMPMLAAQIGKPWVVLRFAEIKGKTGIDVGQLVSQAQQMQPGQYVEQLASAGDLRRLGTATIRGVATTHYAGTVKLDEVLQKYRPDLRRQVAPLMRRAGFDGAHLDAWVDGKGLVRRVSSTTTGGTGKVAVTVDVLAYDVPVDVSPPPASQVADFAQLAGTGSFH